MDNLITAGGVNSFVYDLCIALKEAGQDVTLIGILGDPVEVEGQALSVREAGIPVHCLCMNSKKKALAIGIPKLRRLVKEIAGAEKTICNLHLKLSVLMGGLSTIGLKNVKCVETYHNTYHHYHLEYFLMRPRIKKYITVSETAKQEMFDRFHAPKDKVVAAPNGVDREKLRSMVLKFGHGGEYVSVISVGRLSYEKNLIIPVKAFSVLCNENIRYTVIGDGPQRQEIEESARGNKFIRFLGAVSRQTVLDELATADIIVMPSLWEGRSILQMEAMAFGVPLIISDVPGLREPLGENELKEGELYRQCEFGFIVSTNTITAYSQALQEMLNNKSFLEHARAYINSKSIEIDMKSTIDKYLSAYNSVI